LRRLEITPTLLKPEGQSAAGPAGGEGGGGGGGEGGGDGGGDGTNTPSPGEATPSLPEQAAAPVTARQARRAARTAEFDDITLSLGTLSDQGGSGLISGSLAGHEG
jgi:hypothetical protein